MSDYTKTKAALAEFDRIANEPQSSNADAGWGRYHAIEMAASAVRAAYAEDSGAIWSRRVLSVDEIRRAVAERAKPARSHEH